MYECSCKMAFRVWCDVFVTVRSPIQDTELLGVREKTINNSKVDMAIASVSDAEININAMQ